MFDTPELAIIHKAVSEMTIKGADASSIAALLQKIIDAHRDLETNPTPKKSGK